MEIPIFLLEGTSEYLLYFNLTQSCLKLTFYRTSEMAQDVLELLDYLQWTQKRSIHLVGISMGGMISLEIAKARPQLLASLTLLSTTSGRGNGEKPLTVSLPPVSLCEYKDEK